MNRGVDPRRVTLPWLSESTDITVRLLRADEASLLTALIRRCYGETYMDPVFYDEVAVRRLLESEKLHSMGAFAATGDLVGHMGITARPWGGVTSDAGMTLVDPSFRGKGIAGQVAVGLAQQSVALGLIGVHDYPVTVHAATQRLAKGFGVNTGLMLANMPADVAFQHMETDESGGRSSSLIRWLPFGHAPEREVCLPGRYRERIETLYTEARLSRFVQEVDHELTSQPSALEVTLDRRRSTGRVLVTSVGGDLASRVDAELRAANETGTLVMHVDLPLADRGTPAAVESLRPLGFSFAGLLPEYREGDVLRVQRLDDGAQTPVASALWSDSTRAIEAFVLEDRAALHG